MKSLFISIIITLYVNPLTMDCVEIKNYDFIEKLLIQNNMRGQDYDYQLSTNHAFIYKLQTGEIILIPTVPSIKPPACLLFHNQPCFDECVANDYFPIENYDKQLQEYDINLLKTINTKIQACQDRLNKRYKLNYTDLTREIVQKYYSKVLQDRPFDPLTFLALGCVMGEVLRIELNGKWTLQKFYGPYNPYYSPHISSGDKLADVYHELYSMIDRRTSNSVVFFDRQFYASRKVFIEAGITLTEL